MDELIGRTFLFSGLDLSVNQQVRVKHPTVSEVLSINQGFMCEDLYWSYVSTVLADPYDNMVWLDDRGVDYESVSPLFTLGLRWATAKADCLSKSGQDAMDSLSSIAAIYSALEFFLGKRDFDFVVDNGQTTLIDISDPSWRLSDNEYSVVVSFIQKLNRIDYSGRIHPASPGAKKILIQDMRDEQKRRKKNPKKEDPICIIGDALSVVFAAGSGSITPTNYSGTRIYQLLSASHSIQKQMVVQAMLNGIYTGMLKADKLSDHDLRWV